MHLPLLLLIAQVCVSGREFRFRRVLGYVALSLGSVDLSTLGHAIYLIVLGAAGLAYASRRLARLLLH